MNNASYQTSLTLKKAGLPQPTPQPGMMWWDVDGLLCCVIRSTNPAPFDVRLKPIDSADTLFGVWMGAVFAPTLEYIVPLLPIPELFHFEIWNNTHSCRFLDDENPRRTFGETFTEAAAKMYLELKQNAPGQTFVQPGDAKQE